MWRFDALAFQLYPGVLAISVVLMFLTVSPLHRRFGKPLTAAWAAILAVVAGFAPYALLLAGAWPAPGSDSSTYSYYGFVIVANTAGIVTMISAASMVAEIVEAFQQRTGRRAEGSFYAGNWLVQKCATGAGIFLSGQIISLAEIPQGAQPGMVADSSLAMMIWLYGGASILLALVTAWFLGRFPISRADHEARLSALDAAARADPDASIT